MVESGFCTISNKTKSISTPIRVPFLSIKNKILGEKYQLGLTLVSSLKQKKLNYKYRGINKTTNILTFLYSKNSGEITIDPIKLKKDAPLFSMNYTNFFKFLFIHGCLHLKGYQHSSTMEKEEERFLKLFS